MEAALEAGLVAGETVEFGGQLRVVEDVEVASGGGGELRLHTEDAVEIPGGGNQPVKQDLLQDALGPDLGLELGEKLVEFLAVFRGDDELGGGEPVFAGILRGASLAFLGTRAGAEAGIGGVGGLTSF